MSSTTVREATSVKSVKDYLQLPRKNTSLCLLVVADMDLPSASSLAEAALRDLPTGGTLIDGMIACGPFVEFPQHSFSNSLGSGNSGSSCSSNKRRSIELEHAYEGLVTGCLSQLESIVCRVVWVPSAFYDPSTIICHSNGGNGSSGSPAGDEEYRLTPNSRNIHRQTLPLAPELSCCGLAISSTSIYEASETIQQLLALAKEDSMIVVTTASTGGDIGDGCVDFISKKNVNVLLHIHADTAVATTPRTSNSHRTSATTPTSRSETRMMMTNPATFHSQDNGNKYQPCILYPGSLRERGEYCLVHINATAGKTDRDGCSWQVEKVEIRRIAI